MATHDYNLANQDGASFRSDLNNALAAIVSNNSSSTSPATTFAHQIWVDTTANVIKQRNAANDAWIELWRIDGGFNAKTFSSNVTLNAQSDLRFADSDSSNWVAFQAPATVASNVTWTLPSADGTADQALVTNGSGTLSWADAGGTTDNITEGNTSAEVVDTGSDGHFKVVTEGTEALRVDPSQRLLVGTNSIFDTNQSGTNPSVGVEKANGYATLALKSNQASGNGSYLILGKSRGTSANSKTLVNSGDELGGIYFEGADGSSMRTVAGISATVDAATGAGDIPTRLMFYTTADGASSSTERMRLDSSGRLGIGATSPSQRVDLVQSPYSNVDVFYRSANGSIAGVFGASASTYSGNSFVVGSTSNHELKFISNNTVRAALDTSGNLKFNSGYGSVATAYGCRAWVNFNGTGTISIRADGNVSSLVDNGTGDYTVNYSTSMPDANYSSVGSGNDSTTNVATIHFITNTTVNTRVRAIRGSATRDDISGIYVAIFR